jgi:hypothetical protein
VEAQEALTWFHIHTSAVSAWSYVPRVEENTYATPKQIKKHNATPKSNCRRIQSCGAPKSPHPHKEIKRKNNQLLKNRKKIND